MVVQDCIAPIEQVLDQVRVRVPLHELGWLEREKTLTDMEISHHELMPVTGVLFQLGNAAHQVRRRIEPVANVKNRPHQPFRSQPARAGKRGAVPSSRELLARQCLIDPLHLLLEDRGQQRIANLVSEATG
jgi:hypothetical protein